ncbi:MAG: hypothetical protein WCX65_03680 [bacterium]
MKKNDNIKVRKNFTLSKTGIYYLEKIQKKSLPEMSYSQIVDRAIIEYSKLRKVYEI